MKRFVELLLHISLDLDVKQYKVYMQKTTVLFEDCSFKQSVSYCKCLQA